jgi:hypothetical protein
MKKIKISLLWTIEEDFKNSIIFNLIKNCTKKEIEFSSVAESDLLIFGPYESYLKRKILNLAKKKFKLIENIFPNIDFYLLKRRFQPIKVFMTHEKDFTNIKYDFIISNHLGLNDENHLRFAFWKEMIDWSHLGISRIPTNFIKRFDNFFNIKDLMSPFGNAFMKKEKKIAMICSDLSEPRKSMYNIFSKSFAVDGYGRYFDQTIINHNSSSFTKKEILKKYAFNLCPENTLYPGCYSEKVPEAFLSKSLPITWADKNINIDFNQKSFINLLDHTADSYQEITTLLKETEFLKKFIEEPLLLKEPDLIIETNFIKKILENL